MVALHISSLLTGACIDGEVAGCKRVGFFFAFWIYTFADGVWESRYGHGLDEIRDDEDG